MADDKIIDLDSKNRSKTKVVVPHWGPVEAIIAVLGFVAAQIFISVAISLMLVAFGVSSEIAGSNVALFSIYLAGSVSVVVLLWLWLTVKKLTWKDLGFGQLNWRQLLLVVPIAAMAYIVLSIIFTALTGIFWPQVDLQQAQELGFEPTRSSTQLVLIFVSLVVLPSFIEEAVFRGVVFRGLRRAMPFTVAAIISSLLFGLAHFQFNVALDTAALGLAACWLLERTNSLWPAVALHVVKNSLAFVFVFVIGV